MKHADIIPEIYLLNNSPPPKRTTLPETPREHQTATANRAILQTNTNITEYHCLPSYSKNLYHPERIACLIKQNCLHITLLISN